jgi:hypothetical protein
MLGFQPNKCIIVGVETPTYFLNGVDEVTILEPFDKNIIANLGNKYNIYHKLILHMKLDTQTYYNLRIILGLEHN